MRIRLFMWQRTGAGMHGIFCNRGLRHAEADIGYMGYYAVDIGYIDA